MNMFCGKIGVFGVAYGLKILAFGQDVAYQKMGKSSVVRGNLPWNL